MTRTATARASLTRRRFLRGAGASLVLPGLEGVVGPPRGGAQPVKRFVCLSNNYGVYRRTFFPPEDQPGADYDLPPTLEPLARHRADVTLFTNLDHGKTGGHAGVPVLLSGVRPHLASNYPAGNLSLDQRLAESMGARTRFPSMTLRVNEANLISFTRTGVQVPALDLRQAWRALFEAVPEAERGRQRARYRRQSSILDVVREDDRAAEERLAEPLVVDALERHVLADHVAVVDEEEDPVARGEAARTRRNSRRDRRGGKAKGDGSMGGGVPGRNR